MNVGKINMIVLTLTAEEANWLKTVMQNPAYGCTPEQEWPEDREMREKFFNAMEWLI